MPGIRHLCNHRAIAYRATVTRDASGDTIETWVAQAAPKGLNCRPDQGWSGSLQDDGPGERQGAGRRWFLVIEFDVQERDILKVTEGVEAGQLLRVVSKTIPTTRRRPHHIEVNVVPWVGVLP